MKTFLVAAAVLLATFASPAVAQIENFDGVTAPTLPAGWTESGSGTTAWVTSTSTVVSAPNAAFVSGPATVSNRVLTTPAYTYLTPATLTFQRNNDLEATFDGLVLEISVNGGPFVDAIAAGGAFSTGGYTSTISNGFSSPIGGRQAWSGNSGGFVLTTYDLPTLASGDTVVFHFRAATDSSVPSIGAFIDDVAFTSLPPPPPPIPTLSEWAMILLGLLLAGGAVMTLNGRAGRRLRHT